MSLNQLLNEAQPWSDLYAKSINLNDYAKIMSQASSPNTDAVWVKDNIPTSLIFTNSSGVDINLTDVSGSETLAETLAFGNETSGNDIIMTNGDKITSAGQLTFESNSIFIKSSEGALVNTVDDYTVVANGKVRLESTEGVINSIVLVGSNVNSGMDANFGTGGINIDTTGSMLLISTALTSNAITLNASTGGGGVNITCGTGKLQINSAGGVIMEVLKSGATQAAAGAVGAEIWKTAGHATLPDNVLLVGA